MTITNASGGPIDRLELNTVTPRLGRLRIRSLTVDGLAARPTITDQTIIVPLGGILPDGATTTVRIAFSATTRADPERLELAVHPGERRHPALPLAALDQRRDARSTGRTTAIRS